MIRYPQITINHCYIPRTNEVFHSLYSDVELQNGVKFFLQLVQL